MSAVKAQVVPARASHMMPLAMNMRDADLDEIYALSDEPVLTVLNRSRRASLKCWTVLVDDEPSIIFGVAPISLLSGKGAPWMLATPRIEEIASRFVRHSRRYVDEMQRGYKTLENVVDERNELSKKWLRWLGFEIGEACAVGRHGEMFHPFRRRAANVHGKRA